LPTESSKPNKPTKNELKLLNYLGLSESDGILVTIGDPPCHQISTDTESEPILIPFSNLTCQKDPSLQIDTTMGEVLFEYPNSWASRRSRRIYAGNLKVLLSDLYFYYKAIEDEKLLALKAAEEAELLIRFELDESSIFYERVE
jgi:hypothetical protein